MKLANKENNDLRMCDLKDGDVAVILDNHVDSDYTGIIVQIYRERGNLNALGLGCTSMWSNIVNNKLPVRKLTSGETLVIE